MGDLSSQAGGLLLTFHDEATVLQIYALQEILHTLTLTLQSPKLSLAELSVKVDFALNAENRH